MIASKLRVVTGLLVILALGAAGLTGVMAANEPSAVDEPTEEAVRYAMSFRADFGFQDDESFVLSTYQDPDGFPGSDWGLPLSPSEAADLDERGRLRPLIQPAIDYAVAQPDSAGVWFDQQLGGKVYFSFSGVLAAHAAVLARLMPAGAGWEVVPAEHTMAELRSLQAGITADHAELVAAGIPVTQVVASARLNTVLVGLEEEQPEAEAALRSRYGPAVSTELIGLTQDDACNRRDDCRPLMGGLKIRPLDEGLYFCSSAFQAEKNGERMLVTAGHCVQDWGSGYIWENGADRFGTGANHTLPPPGTVSNPVNADADLGWIKTDAIREHHAGQHVHQGGRGRYPVVRQHRDQQHAARGRPSLPQRRHHEMDVRGDHQHRSQQSQQRGSLDHQRVGHEQGRRGWRQRRHRGRAIRSPAPRGLRLPGSWRACALGQRPDL